MAENTSQEAGPGWLNLFLNTVMIAGVAAIIMLALFPALSRIYGLPAQPPSSAPTLAIIDTEALMKETVAALGKQMRDGEIEPRDMPKKTQAFSEALLAHIDAYAAQNIAVLRTEALLSIPASVVDLTDTVREALIVEGRMPRPLEGG